MAQPTIAVPVEDLKQLIHMATCLSMAASDLLIDSGHAPAPPATPATPAAGVARLDDYRQRRRAV